jgi:predicted XRE-type DNA-binding protein
MGKHIERSIRSSSRRQSASSTSSKRNRNVVSRRHGGISSASVPGSATRARGTRSNLASETEAVRDDLKGDDMIAASTGNIFRDLDREDADELLAKAELSLALTRAITAAGLTQRAAADLLGIAASDVSDLVRGKLRRFSYERLIRLLLGVGAGVCIRVSPPQRSGQRAVLRIEAG